MNNCFQLHLTDGTTPSVISVHPDHKTGQGFIIRKDNDAPKSTNASLKTIRATILEEAKHLQVVRSQEWFNEGYDFGDQEHHYAMDDEC